MDCDYQRLKASKNRLGIWFDLENIGFPCEIQPLWADLMNSGVLTNGVVTILLCIIIAVVLNATTYVHERNDWNTVSAICPSNSTSSSA